MRFVRKKIPLDFHTSREIFFIVTLKLEIQNADIMARKRREYKKKSM